MVKAMEYCTESDWSVLFYCEIEWTKNEVLIHFKYGKRIDCLVRFRGELVNIPFRPWVLHKYNRKEWSKEEIAEDIYRKYKLHYYPCS